MKQLKTGLISLMMIMSSLPLGATHYMGGEITWECMANGNFRFTLKLYRECYLTYGGQAANFGANENINTNVPGFSSISMARVTGWPVDISPVCNNNPSFPHITCTGMTPPGNANMGAVQEHIYTSDTSYPNGVPLTGVPPVNGWVFSHSSCCRNPSTNIIGSNGMSWYLRAIMYPYNNQNVNTCYDNSPKFQEIPRTVICTEYPFTYNHNAYDTELDSLSYDWAQPCQGYNQPITAYATGYTWNSPLPGAMQNPNNVSATINQFNGDISFTSYTQGAFVTVTKVTSYKAGIKVAEIFREIQIVLLQCGTNTPPNVTPPFQNAQGQYTDYTDTVYAGDFVSFILSGTDNEFLPDSSPQTMSIEVTGRLFGYNYTNSAAGCQLSPCATLTPPPPVTGQLGAQTTFNWQTTCNHLPTCPICSPKFNPYTFVVKTSDDFCPAPAINIARISILVIDKPLIPPPKLGCTEVLTDGDVLINWEKVTDTLDSFGSYILYHSTSPAGPFVKLDSIFDSSITSYVHAGAEAHSQHNYYHCKTRSGCKGGYSESSITVAPILLKIENQGTTFSPCTLKWNAPAAPLVQGMTGVYEVYREYPTGIWTLMGLTTNLTYVDVLSSDGHKINYRVEMGFSYGIDSTGHDLSCQIISNVEGNFLVDINETVLPTVHISEAYPNPAFESFAFDYSIPGNERVRVLVRNILGSIIYDINLEPGVGTLSLSTEGMPGGIYTCSIYYGNNILPASKIMVLN